MCCSYKDGRVTQQQAAVFTLLRLRAGVYSIVTCTYIYIYFVYVQRQAAHQFGLCFFAFVSFWPGESRDVGSFCFTVLVIYIYIYTRRSAVCRAIASEGKVYGSNLPMACLFPSLP